MIAAKRLKAVDLFCGAGGTTTGAIASGAVDVCLAINHWRVAVQSHRENHPEIRHVCAEIDHIDPRDFADLGIELLLASPECIFHSNARGGRPVDDQRRATAWCVPRWAEVIRPKWLIVENVREFEDWGPLGSDGRPLKSKRGEIFQAWIAAIRALNYHVEWRLLNAADYGAATKRVRLFIVARRGPSRRPIPWPAATRAKAEWEPAWKVIDWTRDCPSIFSRKRPLAEKTLRRIEIGIKKFVEPFIVKLKNNEFAGSIREPLNTITAGAGHLALAVPFQFKAVGCNPGLTKSIDEPLPTIMAQENHAIVIPFVVPHFGERDGQEPRSHSIEEPLPTVTGQGAGSIAVPFISSFHNGSDGENRNSSATDPLPVVDTQPRHAVVQPFLLDVNHGDDRRSGDRSSSIDKPLGTITTHRGQSVVAPFLLPRQGFYDCRRDKPPRSVDEPLPTVLANHSPAHLVLPFLTEYYANGSARSIEDPLSVVTTKHRHGLALVELMKELGIVDIGFRMLEVDELAAAQGFPPGYQLFGTKAEQIKQVGNSVHTAVAEALCRAIAG